jgi:hypothetical protein
LLNSPHRWVLIFMLVSASKAATFQQNLAVFRAKQMVLHVGSAEISVQGQSGAPGRYDLCLGASRWSESVESLALVGSAETVGQARRAASSCQHPGLENWSLGETLVTLIVALDASNETRIPCAWPHCPDLTLDASYRISTVESLVVVLSAGTAIQAQRALLRPRG